VPFFKVVAIVPVSTVNAQNARNRR